MRSAVALLLAAAAACAIARPPGSSQAPTQPQPPAQLQPLTSRLPSHDFYSQYYLPRVLIPQYVGYDGSPRVLPPPPPPLPPRDDWLNKPYDVPPGLYGPTGPYHPASMLSPDYPNYDENLPSPQRSEDDWVNKEIDHINRMAREYEAISPYEKDLAEMIVRDPYLMRLLESPTRVHDEPYEIEPYGLQPHQLHPSVPSIALFTPNLQPNDIKQPLIKKEAPNVSESNKKKNFALTPLDKGYFDPSSNPENLISKSEDGQHEGGGKDTLVELQPPRKIRQNPNLSKTKTLVAENLDRLRSGLSGDDSGTSEKPRSVHLLEAATLDPSDSIYGVAIISAVGAVLALSVIGFAFGWYTLSKRAKAAADVDYPAYGVTGPTVDMTGDRKLAHSAHMYHYQHQKQQIIAMERNGMEQRNGSVSDPESEEENEEGDYTVYECPGFATTGEMEVKNPLFSEEPTPATPGRCELVKPQPKD